MKFKIRFEEIVLNETYVEAESEEAAKLLVFNKSVKDIDKTELMGIRENSIRIEKDYYQKTEQNICNVDVYSNEKSYKARREYDVHNIDWILNDYEAKIINKQNGIILFKIKKSILNRYIIGQFIHKKFVSSYEIEYAEDYSDIAFEKANKLFYMALYKKYIIENEDESNAFRNNMEGNTKLEEPIINIYKNGKEYNCYIDSKNCFIGNHLSKIILERNSFVLIKVLAYNIKENNFISYTRAKYLIGKLNEYETVFSVFYQIEYDFNTIKLANIVANNLFKRIIKKSPH